MKVVNTEGASAVVYDGEQYNADEEGVFEVPQAVADGLTVFPEWSVYLDPADVPTIVVVESPSPNPVQPLLALEASNQAAATQFVDAVADDVDDDNDGLPQTKAELVELATDVGVGTSGSAKEIAKRILTKRAENTK